MRSYLLPALLISVPLITGFCRATAPVPLRSGGDERESDAPAGIAPPEAPEDSATEAGSDLFEPGEAESHGESKRELKLELERGFELEPRQELEFDHDLGLGEEIDPFGASEEEIVLEMLKLAGVGMGDVVYDLGSGDGRIPIMAARRFGARGVGIEIREELVEESLINAEEAGVSDRVRFIHGDFFENDFGEATVVMLYLFPRTIIRLRPKFLTELRPGARIVANEYGIEGWTRDAEKIVIDPEYPEYEDTIHFWIVPANASGTWSVSIPRGKKALGVRAFTMRLEQAFQHVSGTAEIRDLKLPLESVRLRGADLTFALALPGLPKDEVAWFEGRIEEHRLEGLVLRSRGGKVSRARRVAPWRAVRDPESISAIDPLLRDD